MGDCHLGSPFLYHTIFHLKNSSLFHFIALSSGMFQIIVGILSEKQTALEFFKLSGRNSTHKTHSRFEVFLSKIGMHVKIVKIEFFAIEIIIRIHISSLKKVLPKCEN